MIENLHMSEIIMQTWLLWWKIWLLGLVADFFGFARMFLGALMALGHSNSEHERGWHSAMAVLSAHVQINAENEEA